MVTGKQLRFVICLVLGLATLFLYWPQTHHEFFNVDDPRFVSQNPQVQAGLTWPGIVWAFHSVYTENWQPLTWFSHMLDCQLFGLNAGRHHLTSLLFHIANSLLLFLWLQNLTRATWRSAFVAAFFAWHPLHVESVAWIAERKDMLSTFFWLLTLLAYTRYARKPAVAAYLLVLLLFVLGLMSKPMVVTLPCVMLLLDFWPLNRLNQRAGTETGAPHAGAETKPPKPIARQVGALVLEKIPFFVLALSMGVVTVLAQKAGGAVATLNGLPFPIRLANTLVSYENYLAKTFWPANLSFFYPYIYHLPLAEVIGAALLLGICTGWCLVRWREQPYLLMGWLWFLGTLAPTIGLIQVCSQSMADRYMYIPSIGLFITVVWGLNDLFTRRLAALPVLPWMIGSLALIACLAVTSIELSYWQNSITLARRAIEVTANNYVAYESLGRSFYARGQKTQAINCYEESVRIDPGFPQSQFNLGVALADAGRTSDALDHFAATVQILPNDYDVRFQLGTLLLTSGNDHLDEAVTQLSEAVRLRPDLPEAHRKLAVALAEQGKLAEALPHFAEVVRLQPDDAEGHFNYGFALLNNHQPALAADQFAAEAKLAPNDPKAHYRLAQALAQQGKFVEAAEQYRDTVHLAPTFTEATNELDQLLAAHPGLKPGDAPGGR